MLGEQFFSEELNTVMAILFRLEIDSGRNCSGCQTLVDCYGLSPRVSGRKSEVGFN